MTFCSWPAGMKSLMVAPGDVGDAGMRMDTSGLVGAALSKEDATGDEVFAGRGVFDLQHKDTGNLLSIHVVTEYIYAEQLLEEKEVRLCHDHPVSGSAKLLCYARLK